MRTSAQRLRTTKYSCTKSILNQTVGIHSQKACPRRLLWSIREPISHSGADRFLIQIARGVSDKCAEYVIGDSDLEEVFQSQRDPTSSYHLQRVAVLCNRIKVSAGLHRMSIFRSVPRYPCSNGTAKYMVQSVKYVLLSANPRTYQVLETHMEPACI